MDDLGPIRDALEGASPAPGDGAGFQAVHGGQACPPKGGDGRGGRDWWWWLRAFADAVRLEMRCINRPMTDLGNAERFRLRHGHRFLWCTAWGWMVWDGTRWTRDNAEAAVLQAAQDTVRAIQVEARVIRDSGISGDSWPEGEGAAFLALVREGFEEHRHGLDRFIEVKAGKARTRSTVHGAHGRTSENAGKIMAIPAQVKGLPGMSVGPEVFDPDVMAMTVENGTLHFVRGEGDAPARVELRPHDPADRITKVAPVRYDPAALCPTYDAFMAKIQPDAATVDFLHAWAGYNLTGDISAQCFVILHGAKGANGKSTWESLRGHLMGGYSVGVKIETFLTDGKAKGGNEASPDIARLPGARHVRTSEPPKGQAFAEELIKMITGTETITARHLNKDFFEFLPAFKITVQCNREPKASDDPAFWRRVIKVPFDVSIPVEERDELLLQKLRAEASGVLNHFVAGACRWMDHGLPTVDRIVEATAEYRQRSDVLGLFLRECTVEREGSQLASNHLYRVYQAWCAFSGEKPWTQIGWSKAMQAAGVEKVRSNGSRWQHLALLRDVDAFARAEINPDGSERFVPNEEMAPPIAGDGQDAARTGSEPNLSVGPASGAVVDHGPPYDW